MIKIPRHLYSVLMHIALWVVFLALPVVFESFERKPMPTGWTDLPPASIRRTVGMALNVALIGLFYLNFSWLLPQFYLKGRTRFYFLLVLLSFGAFQLFGYLLYYYVFVHVADIPGDGSVPRVSVVLSALFFVLIWGASSGFRLAEEWRRTESRRRETESRRLEAESRRLEAELNLLKSQINPHFLLNSLNNLYALALTDSEKTPAALLKLSEMVAYILYECDQPQIALDRDLHFIRNYVALQKMRLPPNVVLHFRAPEHPPALDIEPMILITFIENAFKHGLTTKQPCEICIDIDVAGTQLILKVENEVFPQNATLAGRTSGIGLANTRQRLEYSYPQKHRLTIKKSDTAHRVELTIELTPSKQ